MLLKDDGIRWTANVSTWHSFASLHHFLPSGLQSLKIDLFVMLFFWLVLLCWFYVVFARSSQKTQSNHPVYENLMEKAGFVGPECASPVENDAKLKIPLMV